MKKVILLVLIILIIPIVIIDVTHKDYNYYNNNFPDLPKDEKWEFLKERIFNGYSERVFKYNGPILFELDNATEKDSLVVNSILDEFRVLIPGQEIDYFSNYVKKKHNGDEYKLSDLQKVTIKLGFEGRKTNYIIGISSFEDSFRIYNKDWRFYSGKNGLSGFIEPSLHYIFQEDSPWDLRKKEIQRDLVWTISCAQFFQNKEEKIVNSGNSILNRKETIRVGSQFSALDKFLLQKLYSDSLLKEFKIYMYKTYPWRYASNYLNKEKTQMIALWLGILMGSVFLTLGFTLLYKKHYNRLFYNYFVPVIYTMLSILYIYKVYYYITAPWGFEHWRQYISIHVIFVVVALLIAWLLMLFDRYVIQNNLNTGSEILFKTSITFLICFAPVIFVFLSENNRAPWSVLNPLILVVLAFSVGRGLLIYLNRFSESLIREKDMELSRLKEVNAQARVKLLQSQINPHFLYNALNSIAGLAHKNADKTERMALSLSDLFKYTINKKEEKLSTVADEVEMVRNYLDIEQIRFGDRLQFSIHVDNALNEEKIPMFIIQPLVENAIKHGVSKIEGTGKVALKILKSNIGFDIIVEDNGPDFSEGLISGHGLQTVFDLLRLTYKESAVLSWNNDPVKCIKISIDNNKL